MSTHSIDFSSDIQHEVDRLRFQKELRSKIKDLVKLRKQYSEGYKKLEKKYQHLSKQSPSNDKDDQTIRELLESANIINQNIINQNDTSVTTLTELYKSISKKDQFDSLKTQLQRARSNVDRIRRDRTKFEKKEARIQQQLESVQNTLTDRSLCTTKRNELRIKREDLKTQLSHAQEAIKMTKTQLQQATTIYENHTAEILDRSQKYENKCLGSIKEVIQKFTAILQTDSIPKPKNSINRTPQRQSSISSTADTNDEK